MSTKHRRKIYESENLDLWEEWEEPTRWERAVDVVLEWWWPVLCLALLIALLAFKP